jgi:cyanophycin synthetase
MSNPILNASSRILYEEAQRRGITCTTFNDKETILMEKDNKSWYTRGSRTSFLSSVGTTISDLKPLTKAILNHFNLPTAKGVVIRSPEHYSLLEQLQFPVVAKPLDKTHGEGVRVGIKTAQEVQQYFEEAKEPLLCEEMLAGIEYRVVCVDYRFVATAFRKPAHVTGDGSSTIQQLIDQKNAHPWRGEGHQKNLSLIKVDDLVLELLTEQGFNLESVPAVEKEVLLRKTANLSTGGEAWDVTDDVCPENRALFEKIAKVCDLNIIGIDVMCQSLKTPIVDQPKAGVIEVNCSPGLRMHHYPIKGTPRDIAAIILDSIYQKVGLSQ